MIFCGDNSGVQTDVKNGMDGLQYLYSLVQKYNIPDVEFVNFTRDDICRSGITRDFVIAFEEELKADLDGSAIISKQEVDKQFKKHR